MASNEQRITDLETQVASLQFNQTQQAHRIRLMEKRFDTLNTPVWKRLLFRIDGWGAWHYVKPKPRWRPWRRWWTS